MRGGRQSSEVMEQAQQIMNDAGTGETNPAVTGGEMIPQDAQAGEIGGQRTRFLSMVCDAFRDSETETREHFRPQTYPSSSLCFLIFLGFKLKQQERKQATELLMAGHSVSSIAKVISRRRLKVLNPKYFLFLLTHSFCCRFSREVSQRYLA